MEDEFLTIRQVAEILGLSRQRIQQLCAQGRLGRRPGRDWVITRAELEAFKKLPRRAGRPKEGESET